MLTKLFSSQVRVKILKLLVIHSGRNFSAAAIASAANASIRSVNKEIVKLVEAGAVFVNKIVASDPRLAFGGIKKSGFGRELGQFGIKEFVNIKTVWVQ